VEWDLAFESLTDEEASTVAHFFADVQGNLKTFLFVDPLGNLLSWSDDVSQPIWEKDALLNVTSNVPDVFGGETAHLLANGTAALRGIQQTVNAPNEYSYCFSAWVRGAAGARITLTAGTHSVERRTTSQWERMYVARSGEAPVETVTFRLSIEEGGSVEVCGLQAEPQLAPSSYRRGGPVGAVYPNARFRDSALAISDDGPNSHSCRFTVVSNANSL
jgi:hypothetical protein